MKIGCEFYAVWGHHILRAVRNSWIQTGVREFSGPAAYNNWSQGGVPCTKVVCPCCVGFPISPVLWHPILLSLQPGVTGTN
jgi:hypothetical protein